MSRRPNAHPALPLGARVAAFLGFLAVLAALLAPISMLAEEVRTGQLGGICSLNAIGGVSQDGDAPSGPHCDLCGSLAFALPPLAVQVPHFPADQRVAALDFPADLAVTVPGLPYSRGPPRR